MAIESMRTAAWVLATGLWDGTMAIVPRKVWPIRGATIVSSHRTKEAAQRARIKYLPNR